MNFRLPAAFTPKLLTVLKEGYTKQFFFKDLIAGLIVGTVALPLAIAFGIASGVTPQQGLITAIVAGFVISALGGSRVQIGGPTGAFIVVIYGVVQKFGVDGLLIATVLAGIIVLIMGLAKLGGVIKFIPAPVITGFTSGIAIIIFSSQIKDLFGLKMGAVPADLIEKWESYFQHFSAFNWYAVALAAFALLVIIYSPRLTTKIPGPFIALILCTVIVQLFNLPVETIGSKFSLSGGSLPAPQVPNITFAAIKELMPSVITISVLIAIESLLSAVVADGMMGTKHRSNMELVAQGIANILSPIFGGIPATGAIARTATNIKSGGRTPVAGIIHAVFLVLVLVAIGKYVSMIPMPVLAAILVIVSYNMSEWRTFKSMLKAPRSDVIILLTTFILTVVIDLTVAIEVGMILAAFLFMRRMALVTNISVITSEFADSDEEEQGGTLLGKEIPNGVHIFEINGPFFFGAAEKFIETIRDLNVRPKAIILRMRNVTALDATGMKAIEDIWKKITHQNGLFLISEIHSQPFIALEQYGFLRKLGEENIVGSLELALESAKHRLENAV
ncbi:MAG TPA: SulP family inorganic anion transporter [Candidatus Kapabacteria bacterium]|nr:SulP family inorganic anion transporter [Candidatus Kapabacteria bacterium]